MKCTINKEYTRPSQMQGVKDAIKEFKATFSEADLLRVYTENMEKEYLFPDGFYEILKTECNFFPSNDYTYTDVSASIDIIVMGLCNFHKIHFYMEFVDNMWSFCTRDSDILTDMETFEKKF